MTREILVPLDGSPLGDAAIPHAVDLAQRFNAAVTLLHVQDGVSPQERDLDGEVTAAKRRWLERRVSAARSTGVGIRGDIAVGPVAEAIIGYADRHHVGLIVCSTHGCRGWVPRWAGSTADCIIETAPCSVLALSAAGAARPPMIRRMLTWVGERGLSDWEIDDVVAVARAGDADVELLQVVTPSVGIEGRGDVTGEAIRRHGIDALARRARLRLESLAARLRRRGISAEVAIRVHLNRSTALLQRIDESDPDLIVLPQSDAGGMRAELGGIVETALRAGGRPALLLRRSSAATGVAGAPEARSGAA